MEIQLDKKYPIDTEDQLIKAADYFDKYLTRFTPRERTKIACSLDLCSNNLGVNLEMDWITNYGRMSKSASLSPDFEKSIKMRKEACQRHGTNVNILDNTIGANEMLDGISKLASASATTNNLVCALEEFDKQAGIEYLYDKEIVDPIMSVYGSLNNCEFDAVKIAGDSTQYDMIRASRDDAKLASIKESLGDDFEKEFKNNPILSLKKLGSVEKQLLGELTK